MSYDSFDIYPGPIEVHANPRKHVAKMMKLAVKQHNAFVDGLIKDFLDCNPDLTVDDIVVARIPTWDNGFTYEVRRQENANIS